jgi:hypothetical protein
LSRTSRGSPRAFLAQRQTEESLTQALSNAHKQHRIVCSQTRKSSAVKCGFAISLPPAYDRVSSAGGALGEKGLEGRMDSMARGRAEKCKAREMNSLKARRFAGQCAMRRSKVLEMEADAICCELHGNCAASHALGGGCRRRWGAILRQTGVGKRNQNFVKKRKRIPLSFCY